MSLRRRIFFLLLIVVLVGFIGTAHWVRDELRASYAQVAEEVLIEFVNLVATTIEQDGLDPAAIAKLQKTFASYKARPIRARIFEHIKDDTTLELYVTDQAGRVLFSSRPEDVGKDFSQWNDVYKTLRGEYGARATRTNPKDPATAVYYIGAPIREGDKIIGAVTLYKTRSSMSLLIGRAVNNMFFGSLFVMLGIGLIGGFIMVWITRPLERLRQYALAISEGKRVPAPRSNIKDIRQLTEAFETMRIAVEGKKTVESYTQSLTHELKSPLSAIKGAAELCLEEMDAAQRDKFLRNIIDEANRSHIVLEQLLKIAALEAKSDLDQVENVDLLEVVNAAKAGLLGLWRPRGIEWKIEESGRVVVRGDRFLLEQAVRNVLQNAIEFSAAGGAIEVALGSASGAVFVAVNDSGVGIPEFARERVFEKFYSLERPDTRRKSSGLGLSFVKEVVELHRGHIEMLSPRAEGRGVSVVISLPLG